MRKFLKTLLRFIAVTWLTVLGNVLLLGAIAQTIVLIGLARGRRTWLTPKKLYASLVFGVLIGDYITFMAIMAVVRGFLPDWLV